VKGSVQPVVVLVLMVALMVALALVAPEPALLNRR
jgi:hypothetical protein